MPSFEFQYHELPAFVERVEAESASLIKKIIREFSPVQIGDDVVVIHVIHGGILRVSHIGLMAVASCGHPDFGKLSFEYHGRRLTKNGAISKNRNPVYFNAFLFNGAEYFMPSYNRIKIGAAKRVYGGP